VSSPRPLVVTLLLLGVAMSANSEELSDPMKPWDYQTNKPVVAAPIQKARPVLNSIMIAKDRRVAVINGQIVQEGEQMGDMKVIAIEPGRVRLSGAQGVMTLKLLPAPIKRAVGKASP